MDELVIENDKGKYDADEKKNDTQLLAVYRKRPRLSIGLASVSTY